jgi:hypothetical protein
LYRIGLPRVFWIPCHHLSPDYTYYVAFIPTLGPQFTVWLVRSPPATSSLRDIYVHIFALFVPSIWLFWLWFPVRFLARLLDGLFDFFFAYTFHHGWVYAGFVARFAFTALWFNGYFPFCGSSGLSFSVLYRVVCYICCGRAPP